MNFIFNSMSVILCLSSVCSFAEATRVSASIGTSLLFEKNSDGRTSDTRTPFTIGVGLGHNKILGRLEYSRFSTSDGNTIVSVKRTNESAVFWGLYNFHENFYAGLGWGLARVNTDTRFSPQGTIEQNEAVSGSWLSMSAAAIGLSVFWTQDFQVRYELRYELGGGLNTNGARWGAALQAHYYF